MPEATALFTCTTKVKLAEPGKARVVFVHWYGTTAVQDHPAEPGERHERSVSRKRFRERDGAGGCWTGVGYGLRISDVLTSTYRIRAGSVADAQIGLTRTGHGDCEVAELLAGFESRLGVATVAVSVMMVPLAVPAFTL